MFRTIHFTTVAQTTCFGLFTLLRWHRLHVSDYSLGSFSAVTAGCKNYRIFEFIVCEGKSVHCVEVVVMWPRDS